MQFRSDNIIPLNERSAGYGFLQDVCDQLNQLTIERIHPASDSLIPHLIEKIDSKLDQTTNNHDIMMIMEMKNALLKSSSAIISLFKEQSSQSLFESFPDVEQTEDFTLLDNLELDHRLVWFSAAEKMSDKENVQQLFRIKNRFENAFPDFEEQIPATPEKLCESFSTAIDMIHPKDTLKQQLLIWFTEYIKEASDILWCEADQLLEEIGLELNYSIKAPETVSWRQESDGRSLSEIPTGDAGHATNQQNFPQHPDSFHPALMESLAEKLVNQVEDMLFRDDLIPESKKYQVRTRDLAGVLTKLQLEIVEQHVSITNLAESVQTALIKKGENSKLSPRHEDLINLVGMLFEYILDDHLLPDNIRKSIGLLQIPVLRTAIIDHSFLTERDHPARLLLNEMTSAGMECKDNCFTDPIYLLIDSLVRIIISKSYENQSIFDECLERFRTELDIIKLSEEVMAEASEETVSDHIIITEDSEEDTSTIFEGEDTEDHLLEESEFDDAEEIILESSASESEVQTVPLSTTTEATADLETNDEPALEDLAEEPIRNQPHYRPVDGLKIGQWVEFVGEGETHRLSCKLAQFDRDTNRYIFENRSGMKVAECDGNQLLNDIENGSVIIQNDVQIFDRALHAVFEKFKMR